VGVLNIGLEDGVHTVEAQRRVELHTPIGQDEGFPKEEIEHLSDYGLGALDSGSSVSD